MSDTEMTPEDQELALLKERALTLGVPFKSNIGLEALRKKVNDAVEGKTPEATDVGETPVVETQQQIRDRIQAEALALVRVKIYNLNPAKRDLPGEIITVANRYTGTVSKFIPFGEATDNGYHIPKIIFDELKERRFQQMIQKKDERTGVVHVSRRMVPEFSLEVLPKLTVEELEELALKQAAAERLGA